MSQFCCINKSNCTVFQKCNVQFHPAKWWVGFRCEKISQLLIYAEYQWNKRLQTLILVMLLVHTKWKFLWTFSGLKAQKCSFAYTEFSKPLRFSAFLLLLSSSGSAETKFVLTIIGSLLMIIKNVLQAVCSILIRRQRWAKRTWQKDGWFNAQWKLC